MNSFNPPRRRLLAPVVLLAVSLVGCSSEPGSSDAETFDSSRPDASADITVADQRPSDDGFKGDGAPVDGAVDSSADLPAPPSCDLLPSTKVIGNWDLVPRQLFSGTFEVGVVAFHEQGAKVSFTVDGKLLKTVDHPTTNPRTKVVEYWVRLDAANYADGPISLGATLESDCPGHQSRQLTAVTLYANSGGTLSNSAVRWADCAKGNDTSGDGSQAKPYATIEKAFVEVGEGGTVYLAAGSCYKTTTLYPAANYTRWTTVQPAPGVSRDKVAIQTSGGSASHRFAEDHVRWKNVKLIKDATGAGSAHFYFEKDHSVWFDGAELYDGKGKDNTGGVVAGNKPYHVYSTGAYVHDVRMMIGICGFCRDVKGENIGEDVLRAASNLTAINLTIDTMQKGSTGAHPDFFQFYVTGGVVENIVVYNTKVLNMTAQGIFGGNGGGTLRDVAFVNLVMERPAGSNYLSQLTGSWEHILLWHVTLSGQTFWLRESAGLKHFSIENSIWEILYAQDPKATSLPTFSIGETSPPSSIGTRPRLSAPRP
jgi:hypothetical protein